MIKNASRWVILIFCLWGIAACSQSEPVAAPPAPPAPAEWSGDYAEPGQREILWDSYGVPHVYHDTEEGVFYGYGWAQTHSHGNMILRLYGQARGRGAEYWGEDYLSTDLWLLRNDVPGRAAEWLAAQPTQFRKNLEAFAAGINAYAAENPDAIDPEVAVVLPVTATDVMAHAHRLLNFVYVANEGRTIGSRAPPLPAGSNAWAIAPSKTTGNTMMLANPHLPWAYGFFTYYEAHLVGPDFEMYGATQVGLPVIRFAFNQRMGIANTVNGAVGSTSYLLTLDEDGYVFNGETLPFDEREISYKIRQPDGSVVEETEIVRSTVHGPVFERDDGATIALRVAGLDRPGALLQYFDMLRSESLDEFEDVMARLQVPTFNIVYADREGHVKYVSNGIMPKRDSGDHAFWTGLVPGDTSEYVWEDIHDFAELPQVTDPETGFVQNANDPPWIATYPPTYAPEDFPSYMFADEPMSLRPQNSVLMLVENDEIDFDRFVELKLSTYALLADRILPPLFAAAEGSNDPDIVDGVALLSAWDRKYDQDTTAGLLFEAFVTELAGPLFPGRLEQDNFERPWTIEDPLGTPSGLRDPDEALGMLKTAVQKTRKTYGELDTVFSEVSRFEVDGVDLPGHGGFGNLGVFRVITWAPTGEGPRREPRHGETWVAMIEFSTPIKAKGLMSYGNSRQPGTAHYSDQLQHLDNDTFRDFWLVREEVEANTAERTVLPADPIE